MLDFRRILCFVGPNEGRSDAVHRAAGLAKESGAALTLLGVVEPVPGLLTSLMPSTRQLGAMVGAQLGRELEELVEALRAEGLQADHVLRHGKPAEQIREQVLEGRHDLVIKLARGQDGALVGATARLLVRDGPAPVWVVNPGPRERRHVAVAIDPQGETELQQRLLRTARQAAETFGARLDIVHAWELPGAHLLSSRMLPADVEKLLSDLRSEARQRLDELLEKTPGAIEGERVVMRQGHHSPALLDHLTSEDIDLLVLGTVSRTKLARMVIGSTAERVLNQVRCSVLVLQPQRAAATTTPPDADPQRLSVD